MHIKEKEWVKLVEVVGITRVSPPPTPQKRIKKKNHELKHIHCSCGGLENLIVNILWSLLHDSWWVPYHYYPRWNEGNSIITCTFISGDNLTPKLAWKSLNCSRGTHLRWTSGSLLALPYYYHAHVTISSCKLFNQGQTLWLLLETTLDHHSTYNWPPLEERVTNTLESQHICGRFRLVAKRWPHFRVHP